jgi:hypothetical protein
LENKLYITFYIIFAVAYFLDVFIGLFLIDNEFREGANEFYSIENNYRLRLRIFDCVEVGLLATILIEIIVKVAFTSAKYQKQVG